MQEVSFTDIYKTIIVYDTETTGLNPNKEQIMQFGYVVYQVDNSGKYQEVEFGEDLYKTDKPLSEKITQITGITNQDIEERGKDRDQLYTLLKRLFIDYYGNTALLIGYNIIFDMAFVQAELRRSLEDSGFVLTNPIIDVYTIAKDLKKYPHKLVNCLEHWGISGYGEHTALEDSRATYALFKKLMSINFNPQAYVNRVGHHKPIQNDKKFPQIKYVHQTLNGTKDVIRSYFAEIGGKGSE